MSSSEEELKGKILLPFRRFIALKDSPQNTGLMNGMWDAMLVRLHDLIDLIELKILHAGNMFKHSDLEDRDLPDQHSSDAIRMPDGRDLTETISKIETSQVIQVKQSLGDDTANTVSQRVVTQNLELKADADNEIRVGAGINGGGNLGEKVITLAIDFGNTSNSAVRYSDPRLANNVKTNNITSEPGDSEELVMSQKGVTDLVSSGKFVISDVPYSAKKEDVGGTIYIKDGFDLDSRLFSIGDSFTIVNNSADYLNITTDIDSWTRFIGGKLPEGQTHNYIGLNGGGQVHIMFVEKMDEAKGIFHNSWLIYGTGYEWA